MNCTRRYAIFPPALALAVLCLFFTVGCSDDDTVSGPDVNEPVFIYVDGVDGAADGAGTVAEPVLTIQAGIALCAAEERDGVRVAEGVYEVNSSTGSAIVMDPAVSIYGGFRNDAGQWARDPDLHRTTIRDLADAGGTYDAPRAAVACGYGSQAGDPPVIDGFRIEGGGGDMSAGILVSEGSSVTVRDCVLRVGPAADGYGIKNYSTDRESGTRVTVVDCTIGGGGGAGTTGIYVSRGDLTVVTTTVADLLATNRVFAIDCGYGDIVIADCHVSGGTAPGSTRALYLNEAFTSSVTGCAIFGGGGGSSSYGIQAMDTEGASQITGNEIDGGTGTTSVALELGWVEVNPAVDDNVFSASGGTDRFGVYETGNVADPVSLTGNTFDGSLLAGTGAGVFYRDVTANIVTEVSDIDSVNSLDDDGLNPAGTVTGNVVRTY